MKADASSSVPDTFYDVDENGNVVEVTEEEFQQQVGEQVYEDIIEDSEPVMINTVPDEQEDDNVNFILVITVILILSLVVQIVTMLKV